MTYKSYKSYPVAQDPALDGHANMARDRELLAGAEAGVGGCRVYSWDGPWISLGLMQNPERDLLPTNPVPWVVRPTGGKAVLHGHDVTVGLALPLAELVKEGEQVERLSRSVKAVYRRVIAPLVVALRACGLPAKIAEDTRFVGGRGKTADCFAHVSPNDVVHEVTGQKVCGCALRLTSTAVLVQASIPNGPPLVDPRLVYAAPAAMSAFRWDATGFAAALGEAVCHNQPE
jgi:lipoate-protein ligase A